MELQRDWFIHHGDFARWDEALSLLPELSDISCRFDQDAITVEGHCTQLEKLSRALEGLTPWRKGPYRIAQVEIDSEWRS